MHDAVDEAGAPTGAKRELPKYKSYKEVWALEIAKVIRHEEGGDYGVSFKEGGFAPVALPPEMFSRYTPVPGDFYVVYADGYRSFSPRKAFLEGYNAIEYAPGSPDRPPMPQSLHEAGPDAKDKPSALQKARDAGLPVADRDPAPGADVFEPDPFVAHVNA
jgi:hypothetical protein